MFMLKHSVKLRCYLLCGCVAACHEMACVFHAVQNASESHSVINELQNKTIVRQVGHSQELHVFVAA